MSGFDVVGCATCSNLWILETEERKTNETAECSCCGAGNDTDGLRPLDHHETIEGAAELRSRRLAERAGEKDVYQSVLEGVGPYDAQQDEIERQIEDAAPISADQMDLRPIGADRYADLAQSVLEPDRRKFEEWADEYSGIGEGAFADGITLETPEDELYQPLVDEDLAEWAERPDRADLARGEVTLTDQQPANHLASLTLESVTVSQVWTDLFETDTVQRAFAESLVTLFGDLDSLECYEVCEEYGVPFWLRSHIANIARGHSSNAVALDGPADPRRFVSEFVAPLPENPLATTEDLLAVAGLFGGLERSETIAATVREAFVDPDVNRRQQRVDVCDLLAVLATGLDVRLVGSGIALRTLANRHRGDLPGVSEWCNRHRSNQQIDETVNRAVEALDPDGRQLTLLRDLGSGPDGTMSRHALESAHNIGRTRFSQILSEGYDGSLANLGLVDQYGPRGERLVELCEAGRRVLEQFDSEIGRQQSISDFVSAAGNSCEQCRVTPRTGVGGMDGEGDQPPEDRPYRTRYSGRPGHAAAAGTARDGSVTMVNGQIEGENGDDGRVRLVSYNEDRDEAVVGIRAGEPLPYKTTLALALASPRFVDRALTIGRLEEIDDPPAILRDARNIGAVSSDAVDDPQVLRDDLIEWGKDLEAMTTKLANGEYDDRTSFRSAIMRSAHGLAGSIVHLLDILGVDVVREVRVPEQGNTEDLRALAKSIGISAAIQSSYGAFAPYRQLFDVPNCDEPLLSPEVDAADPTGSLIGSFVIRGPDVHRFREDLEYYLEHPRDLVDDAPEFSIDIPIREPSRKDFKETAARVLWRKSIRTTSIAVSVLHALVATPHDAARVLHHRLGSEDETRKIRPDEIRVALRGLEPDALVPDLSSNGGKGGEIVAALLAADESISKQELADRAGVTKKTVYNYRQKLEALGLMFADEDDYRLALSFPIREERQEPVTPTLADSDGYLLEAVDELLLATLQSDRYVDPDDPVGGVLFWPQDPWSLLDTEEYAPWVQLAAKLTGADRPTDDSERVLMGPEIAQKPIAGDGVDPVSADD